MNIIVAVSEDWGIGCNGELLFKIKEDMQMFKSTTLNKVVIMGHDTFKSLPKANRPLKDRTNIVLSRDKTLAITGVQVCNSLEELHELINQYKKDDIFIIGGESIYNQLLDSCTVAYVTKIQATSLTDKFFPNLDSNPNWLLVSESETKSQNDLAFSFCIYKKSAQGVFATLDQSI